MQNENWILPKIPIKANKFIKQFIELENNSKEKQRRQHLKLLISKMTDLLESQNVSFFQFPSEFRLQLQQESQFSDVMIFYVRWGYFAMYMTVLNLEGRCVPEDANSQQGKGSFGRVFKIQFKEQIKACKSVALDSPYLINSHRLKQQLSDRAQFSKKLNQYPKQYHTLLVRVLKEYFISRICSIFKIGPKIDNLDSFDLLCFQNGVQFMMERCETNYKQAFKEIIHNEDDNYSSSDNNNKGDWNDQLLLKIRDQLSSNLRKLHLLGFVHKDIKPENIMYSPYFKKMVFIDFGISTYLAQTISQETACFSFQGTYNYASRQMKELLLPKRKLINLYNNDYHCLETTLEQVSKRLNQNWSQHAYTQTELAAQKTQKIFGATKYSILYDIFVSKLYRHWRKHYDKISQVQIKQIQGITNKYMEFYPREKDQLRIPKLQNLNSMSLLRIRHIYLFHDSTYVIPLQLIRISHLLNQETADASKTPNLSTLLAETVSLHHKNKVFSHRSKMLSILLLHKLNQTLNPRSEEEIQKMHLEIQITDLLLLFMSNCWMLTWGELFTFFEFLSRTQSTLLKQCQFQSEFLSLSSKINAENKYSPAYYTLFLKGLLQTYASMQKDPLKQQLIRDILQINFRNLKIKQHIQEKLTPLKVKGQRADELFNFIGIGQWDSKRQSRHQFKLRIKAEINKNLLSISKKLNPDNKDSLEDDLLTFFKEKTIELLQENSTSITQASNLLQSQLTHEYYLRTSQTESKEDQIKHIEALRELKKQNQSKKIYKLGAFNELNSDKLPKLRLIFKTKRLMIRGAQIGYSSARKSKGLASFQRELNYYDTTIEEQLDYQYTTQVQKQFQQNFTGKKVKQKGTEQLIYQHPEPLMTKYTQAFDLVINQITTYHNLKVYGKPTDTQLINVEIYALKRYHEFLTKIFSVVMQEFSILTKEGSDFQKKEYKFLINYSIHQLFQICNFYSHFTHLDAKVETKNTIEQQLLVYKCLKEIIKFCCWIENKQSASQLVDTDCLYHDQYNYVGTVPRLIILLSRLAPFKKSFVSRLMRILYQDSKRRFISPLYIKCVQVKILQVWKKVVDKNSKIHFQKELRKKQQKIRNKVKQLIVTDCNNLAMKFSQSFEERYVKLQGGIDKMDSLAMLSNDVEKYSILHSNSFLDYLLKSIPYKIDNYDTLVNYSLSFKSQINFLMSTSQLHKLDIQKRFGFPTIILFVEQLLKNQSQMAIKDHSAFCFAILNQFHSQLQQNKNSLRQLECHWGELSQLLNGKFIWKFAKSSAVQLFRRLGLTIDLMACLRILKELKQDRVNPALGHTIFFERLSKIRRSNSLLGHYMNSFKNNHKFFKQSKNSEQYKNEGRLIGLLLKRTKVDYKHRSVIQEFSKKIEKAIEISQNFRLCQKVDSRALGVPETKIGKLYHIAKQRNKERQSIDSIPNHSILQRPVRKSKANYLVKPIIFLKKSIQRSHSLQANKHQTHYQKKHKSQQKIDITVQDNNSQKQRDSDDSVGPQLS